MGRGNVFAGSLTIFTGGGGYSNEASATPQVPVPTLISDPDNTIRTAETTTLVCYNLVSVSQGGVTYLEARQGKTAVTAHSALSDASLGVEITQAPAGITKGRGVNLNPCVNLGKGTHTVTWSWRGQDGAATAVTTSTTITITDPAAASRTITLSATSTSITEGNSGFTDVTVTATLGEAAPAGFSITVTSDSPPGTATGSNKGRDPCTAPLIPVDTDWCYPASVTVSIAEGETQGTMKVRILGDTRDESNETIRLIGYETDWTSGRLTLTITDDDDPVALKPPTRLTVVPGPDRLYLSWTAPTDSNRTGWRVRHGQAGVSGTSWGDWSAISGAGATSHTITGLSTNYTYYVELQATDGSRFSTKATGSANVRSGLVHTLLSGAFLSVNEGGSKTYSIRLISRGTGPVTVTPASANGDLSFSPTSLTFSATNWGKDQNMTVSAAGDTDADDEDATITYAVSGGGYPSISDTTAVKITDTGTSASVTPTLAQPRNLRATAGNRQVSLAWTKPPGAITGYEVRYVKTGAAWSEWTAIPGSGASTESHTVSGLDGGSSYTFEVRAVNSAGKGLESQATATPTGSSTPIVTAPAAPTGLSAEAGNGQVVLSWSDPDNDSITRYEVRYGKVGESWGAWTAISNSDADTTGHTVPSLDNGSEYRFRIRAVNNTGNGAQSVVVRATPVVPATAGVTLSATSLTVEEGSSNTYTVKLDKAPSANVTITVSGASGDVTVAGSPLTFTPGNFSATQTITVRAAADEDTTDDTATLTHAAASSDTDYGASLEIDDVDVTVTDTTPTLQLSTDPAAVTEGTDIRLTVTSDQALTGNLTVSLTLAARDSSSFTAEDIAGTLGPRNFTAAFGNSASATGTVTIPTSADSAVEGAEAYRITLNDAAGYALGDDVTADGTLNDGAVSAPAAPSDLTASAGNEQVVLAWSDPDDDSITRYEVRYGKTGERSGAPWNAIPGSGANTGSHAVTGLDNDAQYSFQLRAVNPSGEGSATDWVTATPVSSSTVALTIADVTAPESAPFTFTVTADSAPASAVTFQYTVTARSRDTATAGADFTAVTTATAKILAAGATRATITVAVTDDERDENDETFTVTLSEPSANAMLANTTATGTISDDDESPVLAAMADRTLAAGQAVDLTASATDGDGDSVSYVWTRKVGENTPALPEGTALNQARLRFTIPATATGRYTMTVTASDGHGNTDSKEVVITVGGAAPPSGEPPVETPVETPTPVAGVTLSASALTVEEGGSGNYTVILDAQPTDEVMVTIGGVSGDVTAIPASLTFTSANYNTAQTVTVTAAEDDDAVTDAAVTLTHNASGGGYGSVSIDAVTVTISEDDEAGVTLSSSTLTLEEGRSGNYTVVLDSQPVGGEVTVTPGSVDSSALTVMPSALRFTAANWNMAQTVTVTAVEDDDTDDESVRVSHAVSGGDYGSVVADSVTVTVTDTPAAGQVGRANRVNARVLPEVAAATLSQTLTAVTERIGAVASGQPAPASLQFGALPGRTLEEEWGFLPRSEPSAPSVSEMLDGATFALPLQMSGDSAAVQPSGLAAWGRGERVSLSGTEEEVSWDGDLWSAHLGVDMYIRSDLLAGAALSYGEGEVDTQTTESDGSRIAGTYETTLTAIHPYVSHVLADGSHLWGSMGYGQGEARIREGSATRKTDLSQWSVALGGRRVLLEDSQRIAGGLTRIALKGEGALAQLDTDAQQELTELTVKTTRLRLLLEGSHERALQGGATVTPALEAGLRHDGGDLGSGLGLEAGASLTWRDPQAGWLAELRARSLVAHEKDRDEWGISALVRMEPGADGRGLSLTFGPEYGHTDSGMESWFDYRLSPATTNSATRDDREGRLEAELGYGIGVSRTGAMALLTPYTGFSLGQSGSETFRVGARYRLGEGLSVGIEGKHQPQAVGENSLMLRAAIRW